MTSKVDQFQLCEEEALPPGYEEATTGYANRVYEQENSASTDACITPEDNEDGDQVPITPSDNKKSACSPRCHKAGGILTLILIVIIILAIRFLWRFFV